MMLLGPHTELLTRFHFAPDVHRGRRIVTNPYHNETRPVRERCRHFAYLGFYGSGNFLAAQQFSCHFSPILQKIAEFGSARNSRPTVRVRRGREFAGSRPAFGIFFGITWRNVGKFVVE
jgi:hypothetical protein